MRPTTAPARVTASASSLSQFVKSINLKYAEIDPPKPKLEAEPKVQIMSIHDSDTGADQCANAGADADAGADVGASEAVDGRPETEASGGGRAKDEGGTGEGAGADAGAGDGVVGEAITGEGEVEGEGDASTLLQTMQAETVPRPNTAAPDGEGRSKLRSAGGTWDAQRPKTAPGHTGFGSRKEFDMDNDGDGLDHPGNRYEKRNAERSRAAWTTRRKQQNNDEINACRTINTPKLYADRSTTAFRNSAHNSDSIMSQVVEQADAIHADLGIDIMYGTIGPSEKKLVYPPKKTEMVKAKTQKQVTSKLAEPRYRRRKGKTSGVVKSGLEWEMIRACRIPGPGAYDCPMPGGGNELHLSGKFVSGGQTLLDVYLKSKTYVPSPQDYDPPAQDWKMKGIVFTNGRQDTEIDMKCKEAAHQPGPGQYAVSGSKTNRVNGKVPGGVWTKKPREFKLSDKGTLGADGKATPGPGDYRTPEPKDRLGGKISITRRTSFLHNIEQRGRTTPGPGRYQVETDHRTRPPSGGRFNEARTKSQLEWLIYYENEKQPGPGGSGTLPSTLNPRGGRINSAGDGYFELNYD